MSKQKGELGVIKVKGTNRLEIKIVGETFTFKESSSMHTYLSLGGKQTEIIAKLNTLNIDWENDSDEEIRKKIDPSLVLKKGKNSSPPIISAPPAKQSKTAQCNAPGENSCISPSYAQLSPSLFDSNFAFLLSPGLPSVPAQVVPEKAQPQPQSLPQPRPLFQNLPKHSIFSVVPGTPQPQPEFSCFNLSPNGSPGRPSSRSSDFFHTMSAKNSATWEWISAIKLKGEEAVVSLEWDNEFGLLYTNEPFNPEIHQRVSATSFNFQGVGVQGPVDALKRSGDGWRVDSRVPVVTVGMTKVKCLFNSEVERLKREHADNVLVQEAAVKEVRKDGTMVIVSCPEVGVGLCVSWKVITKNDLSSFVIGSPMETFVGSNGETSKEIACWIAPVLHSRFEKELSEWAEALNIPVGPKEESFLNPDFNPHDPEEKKNSAEFLSVLQNAAIAEINAAKVKGEPREDEPSSPPGEEKSSVAQLASKLNHLQIQEKNWDSPDKFEGLCFCGYELSKQIKEEGSAPLECTKCKENIGNGRFYACPRKKVIHFPGGRTGCDLCHSCFAKKCEKINSMSLPLHEKLLIWRNTSFAVGKHEAGNKSLYAQLLEITKNTGTVHLCKNNLSALWLLEKFIERGNEKKNVHIVSNAYDSKRFVKKVLRGGALKENLLIYTDDCNKAAWCKKAKVNVTSDGQDVIKFVKSTQTTAQRFVRRFLS